MAVAGSYRIEANTPMGRQQGSIHYRVEGRALTGTATAMGQTVQVLNGRVDGNRFSHGIRLKTPLGGMNGRVSGIVTGNQISGIFELPMGKYQFLGERTGL